MIAGMIATVMPIMAEGVQEESRRGAGPAIYQGEQISLTGSVVVQEDGQVLLSADGKEYTLLYPRILQDDVELENGDQLVVSGIQVPGPRGVSDASGVFVHVEKVVIDGEEYELENAAGPRGGMAGRGQRASGSARNGNTSRGREDGRQGSPSQQKNSGGMGNRRPQYDDGPRSGRRGFSS